MPGQGLFRADSGNDWEDSLGKLSVLYVSLNVKTLDDLFARIEPACHPGQCFPHGDMVDDFHW